MKGMMSRLGFSAQWIKLVMNCIMSILYSVVVNGEPNGMISQKYRVCEENTLLSFSHYWLGINSHFTKLYL